jgi:hypothetical protein
MHEKQHPLLCTVGLLLALAVGGQVARAGQIVYSWTGTVVEQSASFSDPWMIGPTGKPFNIAVTVDQAATDLFANIISGYAAFHYSSITYSIAGVPATSTSFGPPGSDAINFADNYQLPSGDFDSVGAGFAAQFDGVTLNVAAGFLAPAATFSLAPYVSPPPFFGTVTASAYDSWQSPGTPYNFQTNSGIKATSTLVPEPSTLALAALGFLALAAWRLRHR